MKLDLSYKYLTSSHQHVACAQPVVDSGTSVNIHYHFCQLLQNINHPFSEVRVVAERDTAEFDLYMYDDIRVGHGETFYKDRGFFSNMSALISVCFD